MANKRAHSEESNDKDARSKKNRVEETVTKLKEAHPTLKCNTEFVCRGCLF